MKNNLKNVWFWVCIAFMVPWFIFFMLGNGLLLPSDVPRTTNICYILLSVLSLVVMRLISKKKLEQPLSITYECIFTVGLYLIGTFLAPALR